MSDKRPVPADQRRQEAYNEMPKALQKIADFVFKKTEQQATGNLRIHHAVGEKVLAVLEDEDTFGIEGKSIDQLSAYTGWTKEMLFKCRDLQKIYPDWAELEAIATTPFKNGNRVTVTHMFAIVKLVRATDRKKLVKQMQEESLTTQQLETEIAALGYDKTNVRTSGRKPSKPTSPKAGYQEMFKESQRINNRFKHTWKPIFDEVEGVSPDKIDPQLLKKAEEALDQMDTLENNLMESRPKLQGNVDRMRVVISDREKAEKAPVKKTKKKKVSKKPPA